MATAQQAQIDFEAYYDVPARPAAVMPAPKPEALPAPALPEPALPQSFIWQGQACKVNWIKHTGHTFYQAGVSFPDRSATLMVVKVFDTGELKPVLCWYGPPTNGVMSDEERQARAACGL